ncbi:MAG: helix-turn-helix transcriptional regulator [Myxococcales bacterium]|nr:helix-turn-helix transcriptional regulator [Myxococcales bacterium]
MATARPSLRAEQAEAVRNRLFEAALELIETGQEPTLRAVAAQARVGERTLYRYFPSRDDFRDALGRQFHGRAGIPLCEDAAGLEGYARDLFATFEANSKLVRGLVHAPWAVADLQLTRRRRLEQVTALLRRAWPDAPVAACEAAAASLRAVLSGAGWCHLRDCGFSAEEALHHALWLVRTILDRLASLGAGRG